MNELWQQSSNEMSYLCAKNVGRHIMRKKYIGGQCGYVCFTNTIYLSISGLMQHSTSEWSMRIYQNVNDAYSRKLLK